jgi:hypothetical protein
MSETTNFLSKSINVLQEERAALVLDVEAGRCQILELNKKIDELRMDAAKNDVRYQSLHSALGSANLLLTDRNKSISELEIKLSQCKQDAIFATSDANNARSSLEDVTAQLKACESKYASRCAVLQQDLSDSRSSNAVLLVKLESTEGSLDAALRSLEDCRKVIAQSNTLKDIVERGISKLDKNIAESGSLLESSRDDLRALLSRSKEISAKLSVSSDAASDNATSIESRLGQLQEAVSTLSSSTLLKSFSDETRAGLLNVKRTVDDLLEHHTSSITGVQQRLDDVSRVQQSESLRQHMTGEDAQKQLDVIIELQRSSAAQVQAEVLDVEHRLKDVMSVQSNELTDVVKSGVCKLDENIVKSGSLLETSRDDLRLLLSRSKDISDKLFVASDAASDNATSIESRLGQLQEAVSTLSSSTLLKSFSDETRTGLLNVKRTVDDLLEHHTSSITGVQQRLDDVSRVQQSESLRQHMTGENAQKQLDVIIELQRSNTVQVHADVTNAEQRLKDFMLVQSNELTDVVKSGVCKLDENIAESGSLLETSRDDLRLLLSRSQEISDKVSVASDASIHNATSIERRLGQLQEVVSALFSFPPRFMIRNGSNHRSRDRSREQQFEQGA